ncbi:KaiC domain-containing protein, partial [archaeon]|nr:KaiC domain-containing protein [archaeon]
EKKLVLIDALMGKDEQWSLKSLELEELVEKIIEGKKFLGFGRSRVVVDSLSAFWLDKPAMARRYSYYLKKVLSKWDFTILVTSQYAITTSSAFGWGVEHVSDGIIRFRRGIREGILKRYVIVEKMRQTQHSLQLHEINIENGRGLSIVRATEERREDYALPKKVSEKIKRAEQEKENSLP